MKIKQQPEDFIVEEVHSRGVSTVDYTLMQKLSDFLPKKRKRYLHCDLVKRNYTTERAVARVSSALGMSKRRISYAGTKDKMALTSQRIAVERGEARKLRIKDIRLKNFSYRDHGLKMGELVGNRFTIKLRDITVPNATKRVQKFIEQSKSGIKNYFGEQRFGKRCNNHMIGKRMIKADFESAVKLFLTDTGDEPKMVKEAREWLKGNWGNWGGALQRFPTFLGLERGMLEYLKKHDNNFTGAVRKMPRRVALLFVHAYQAHIFNACLERDDDSAELPLVGYETKVSGVLKEIMDEEGIKAGDFRVKEIPWLSCRGSSRKTRFDVENFKIIGSTDKSITISFILGSGTYATVLIRELADAIGGHVEV